MATARSTAGERRKRGTNRHSSNRLGAHPASPSFRSSRPGSHRSRANPEAPADLGPPRLHPRTCSSVNQTVTRPQHKAEQDRAVPLPLWRNRTPTKHQVHATPRFSKPSFIKDPTTSRRNCPERCPERYRILFTGLNIDRQMSGCSPSGATFRFALPNYGRGPLKELMRRDGRHRIFAYVFPFAQLLSL